MKALIVLAALALGIGAAVADDAAAPATTPAQESTPAQPAAPAASADAPAAASAPAPAPAPAPAATPAAAQSNLDVHKLFATTCGWCHSGGGRAAGKGPQLMDSKRTDDFIRNRIKNGKLGGMPAFGTMFNDADIDRIIAYIRALKPET